MAAAVGLGAVLTAATLVWVASVRRGDASTADACWGPGFVLLVWIDVVLSNARSTRAWVVAALVTVWGARLYVHLVRRSRGKAEDPRYQAMRAAHGAAFWWRSLFIVFWLQAAILWFVALPVFVAVRSPQPPFPTLLDLTGVLIFAIGFTFEAVGDRQLARFRSDPANRGKVLDTGLWRYCRHPNYFGDATIWWGVYAIAASTPGGWLTALSPAFMTLLLLRVSGVTLLEEALKTSKPDYRAYMLRTSAFVPWFPRPESAGNPRQ